MRIESPRFGAIDADASQVIHFEHPLPGFPECRSFVLIDHDQATPLKWMVSVEQPEISFLLVDSDEIEPSYDVELPDWLLSVLEWKSTDDPHAIGFYTILSAEGDQLFANPLAPIVVNRENRLAVQLIRDEPDLPSRHPVIPVSSQDRDLL